MGAERDITLHQRVVGLQRISDTLPAYDPLHFSLLFPHGGGWHLAVRYQGDATSHNNLRVSYLDFAYTDSTSDQWVLIVAARCKIKSKQVCHANYRNACV